MGKISSLFGKVLGISSAQNAAKAQQVAQMQAMMMSKKQADAADEASNKANQKRANPFGALAGAQQAGKGGVSGTMLTGAQGVNPGSLQLGGSTLLGR